MSQNLFQIKRGTTTKRLLFLPENGELIFDLETKTLYIGDGETLGGIHAVNFDEISPTTTKGDLIVFGENQNEKLSLGLDNQILSVDSTSELGIKWVEQNDFNDLSPTTTKGDLIYNDGTNNSRLAKGSQDQVLISDDTDGIKWVGLTYVLEFEDLSPTTAKGDLIYNDGTNNSRLAKGSQDQVLISDDTDGIKWRENNSLLLTLPATDLTSKGIKTVVTVGENVVFGETLYLKSDGKYYKSNASSDTTMFVTAVALETILQNNSGTVLKLGYIRDDSWNWTVGGQIFAATTAGDISQTQPVTVGHQVQSLGYAENADILFFNPSFVVIEV